MTPDMTPWSYPNNHTPIERKHDTVYNKEAPWSFEADLPWTMGMAGSCSDIVRGGGSGVDYSGNGRVSRRI